MIKNNLKYLSYLLFIILVACNSQKSNEELLHAIRNRNFEDIKSLVKQGVDLNNLTEDGTALHLAIKNRQITTSILLIKSGAELNTKDSDGLTPLHWSAKRALPEITKALIKYGCDINCKDHDGYTPLNYAIKTYSQENINILLRNGALVYKKDVSNLCDGPFVDWTEDGMYAYYLRQDSISGTAFMSGKSFDSNTKSFDGWEGDTCFYHIPNMEIPRAKINTNEPIFVLGDIHGQYDRMISNLKTHGVINDQLKWSWGKGHLVYVGDIFDRGLKVTESLWLIFRLEQEAKAAGGQVHFVFGNHELMVLENDLRYIAPKYEKLCENLGLNYTNLFHPNSVLGEWLRSQNSTIQINDVLFVHGGISPQLVESGITLDEINILTRKFLVAGTNPNNEEKYDQIMRSHGPFWYRGYFMSRKQRYDKISENELAHVLNKMNISTIVVGHTETDELSSSFDGKIIDVNIPLAKKDVPNQALLIKDGKFYHLSENNKIIEIK